MATVLAPRVYGLDAICAAALRSAGSEEAAQFARRLFERVADKDLAAVEATTLEVGRYIFEHRANIRPSVLERRWWDDHIMSWAMQDESVKVQMFRFVDVLASLRNSGEIVRHLDEYFATMRNGFAPLLQTGVRAAKIVPGLSSWFLRFEPSVTFA